MRKINYFLDEYKELIWVFLMGTLCIADIYVLSIEWNVWSLIGAVCCGLSAILNLNGFVMKLKNK